jgi:PAS domain S-box-containing protein
LAANLIYDVPLTGDQLTADADLNFAGRHFKIMVAVPKNYSLENYESYVPMGVVVIGTIVSLLVVYVTYLLLLSRSRAMQLSEKSMQNLRESEGKFRAVIEAAKDAILIVNEQNNIILWNKAAENLFGYKESEALGQPWQIIFAGKPTDLVIKNIMKAVSTQSSNLKDETFEILTKAKDGKKMNTEASISIARIDNRWHYICILRNITAKKKAEEELLTRSQELEKLNSLMLGREEKMIELKKQLEALQNKK